MTLSDVLTACYQDLGYDPIPGPSVQARLTRYVNEGYRHILSMDEFGPLRSNTLPFVSVAGQKTYGWPQAFVQIEQVVNLTQNVRLRLMTQDQVRTIDPQEISSGTPTHYVPLGMGPTLRDPNNTGVWAVSSSAADITPIVTVQGVIDLTTGMTAPPKTATLTGTARVQVGTLVNYVVLQQFQLNTVAVGIVTLFDAAAVGNVLAQIAPGQLTVQYQQMRLWPTPSAADQYAVDGSLAMLDLTTVTDIPVLPSDFQLVLCDYARMREYEYRDDSRAAMAASMYASKLKQMKDRIMNPPDYRPRVGRIPDRGSNLGPYFPRGRW